MSHIQMMAALQQLGGPVLEMKGPNKKTVARGLPSVVVDADLIRQMNLQTQHFDGFVMPRPLLREGWVGREKGHESES